MRYFDEMMEYALPLVAAANQAVTLPMLRSKAGMQITDAGTNLGEVVTTADTSISNILLNTGIDGFPGLRTYFPGSFSEEEDRAADRRNARKIFQVDPLDWTGDFLHTKNPRRRFPGGITQPTTLVSMLVRDGLDDPFRPVAGMIYNILHDYAIVGADGNVVLFAIKDGEIQRLSWTTTECTRYEQGKVVRLGIRSAYPQRNYIDFALNFLEAQGLDILLTRTGGAGLQALQVIGNFIIPLPGQCDAFRTLPPIHASFNCQPDWKTWDTDPAQAILSAIGVATLTTDIYGDILTANAAEKRKHGMIHRTGTVMSADPSLEEIIVNHARIYRRRYSDRDLLTINY